MIGAIVVVIAGSVMIVVYNYLTFLNGPLNIGLAIAVVVVLFLPQILDLIRGGKIKEEFADPGAEV
jgi:hypothetical protein